MKEKTTRREFMRMAGAATFMAAANPDFYSTTIPKKVRDRNILFISIDDLNDWVGCMGGHPLVRTPNIDRIASSGVLFSDAHCAAPVCNPSRTSVMTGISPTTSGVYTNTTNFRSSPVLKKTLTVSQNFRMAGYKTMRAGKVMHSMDAASWEVAWPPRDKVFPLEVMPPKGSVPMCGVKMDYFFDWGPLDVPVEDMADMRVASRVAEWLSEKRSAPFFIGCGFVKPHMPLYVPRKYFEMYPLKDIDFREENGKNDLRDVPQWAVSEFIEQDSFNKQILDNGLGKSLIQAYLAAVTYVDDCVGKVYDALVDGGHLKDTVVVLWSDNGFHLGEKMHWAKSTLWKESTRCPLVISAPGLIKEGVVCDSVVSLMDIYPTLTEMCGLMTPREVEGESLAGMLKNPSHRRSKPVISTIRVNNHAVITDEWRYIKYMNGDTELYDRVNDPDEWTNLAEDRKYARIISDLDRWVPRSYTFTKK